MIRETLGNVHLPPTFTENIRRQIADIKPASSSSKPLIPVALSAATAIFIFLIIGTESQYLVRFQKPYNLNAQSETTVEIIEAPIALDTKLKPDLRNQAGRFDATGENKGAGQQVSEPVMLAAAQIEKETRLSTKQQWIQAKGPEEGGSVSGLFVSSWRDVYAASPIGIYRSAPNASAWTFVSSLVSSNASETSGDYQGMPMAEQNDILYLVFTDSVLASKDRGETWTKLGERPKGSAIGLVITDDALYLALRDEGIFLSTDAGKQWTPLKNDEINSILAIVGVENRVFVGTNRGLYRVDSGTWRKASVDTSKAIHSLAVSGNNLYVGTGPDFSQLETAEGRMAYVGQIMDNANARAWEILHSSDLGDSWTDITPTSKSPMMNVSPGIKVLAAEKAIMALGMIRFHSIDGGKTWTEFGFNFDPSDMNAIMNATMLSIFPAVAVDENTLLKAGAFGLTRSINGGESWAPFMNGIVGIRIFNLVGFKNELYTSTSTGVTKSIDGGESWKKLPMNSGELTLKPSETDNFTRLLVLPKLAITDGGLYGITSNLVDENEFHLFSLSMNGNVLVPIQGVPTLGEDSSITDIMAKAGVTRQLEKFPGAFAVSGETFYVEYMRQLLRWKRGESEWFNTGLIDTGKSTDEDDDSVKGFRLSISEETVYVGKRDGSLFRSLDSGNTWKDLTPNLPLRFEHFNAITCVGSTVYVATDAGVLTSEDGEHWDVITDKARAAHTTIDQMAIVGTEVYGAGDAGVYQLNNLGEWEKIAQEVPDKVTSLVINADRLYVATERRGMFHISLKKEW